MKKHGPVHFRGKKIPNPKTGALGYSSRAPWSPDVSARTGGMITALMVVAEKKNLPGHWQTRSFA